MTTSRQRTDRPLIITALCLVGIIGIGLAVVRMLQQWELLALQPTAWLIASVTALLVSAACIYGFWRMKRWAVILLALALIARLGWSLLTSQPLTLSRTLWPVLLLAVALLYVRRMD